MATTTAKEGTEQKALDPRVVSFAVALVPGGGGPFPTDEQRKVGEQIQGIIEGAQKSASEKKVDKAGLDESVAAFFSGDVSDREAKKKAQEEADKDAEQHAAAIKAANQPAPSTGKPAHT